MKWICHAKPSGFRENEYGRENEEQKKIFFKRQWFKETRSRYAGVLLP
jgi:hypothetical protein